MNLQMLPSRILKRAINLTPRHLRLRLKYTFAKQYSIDPELLELSRWLPENRRFVALDIGANFGVTTCAIASVFEFVHAFEPNREILGEWDTVAPRNVTVWDCALSDHVGTAPFHVPLNNNNRISGLGSLERLSGDAYASLETQRVELKTLDTLLPTDQRIDFIKIDVEGHELSTLRGGLEMLKRDRPTITIEVWPENRMSVHAFFSEIGYQVVPLQKLLDIEPFEQNLCFGPSEYWGSVIANAA